MKNLPACKTDIVSGFLCSSCQERLENDQLTQFELDLAKGLIELEEKNEKFSYLKDVSFYKAIDFEDVVILVVGPKDRVRISKELLKWIKENYEIQNLILVEKSSKPRPVLEGLIAPGKLSSLNELFLATGEIEFKAIIRKEDKEKILFTEKELEDLVLELTGSVIRVEFQ